MNTTHGEDDAFLLPQLAEECYLDNEPHVTQFDALLIGTHGRLANQMVVTTGCALDTPSLGDAFLGIGCRGYIGSADYVEDSAGLFFIVRFYYELMANQRLEAEAFRIANSTDAETELFRLYKHPI